MKIINLNYNNLFSFNGNNSDEQMSRLFPLNAKKNGQFEIKDKL